MHSRPKNSQSNPNLFFKDKEKDKHNCVQQTTNVNVTINQDNEVDSVADCFKAIFNACKFK